ncbi:hypothetical protein PHMEG_00036232, partial [Phytophthora megakarya]
MSGEGRPGAAAYADDLKTFSSTVDGTKRQHAIVADFLRWTGMAANPKKCSIMSVQRDTRGVLKTCDLGPQLDGVPIPALGMADAYTYLGIGDGFDHVRRRVELAPMLTQLKHDATALLQSGLAPWQVVKAVKVYLYPRVEYALRHLRPFAQQLEGFDTHLAHGLRHLLRLPKTATTAFISGIRHRLDTQHWCDREEELCELFLNDKLGSSAHAPPKRRNGDIGSLWADVRGHLKRFGLQLAKAPADLATDTPDDLATDTPEQPLQLRVPHHDKWLGRGDVLRHVKLHLKHRHWAKWAAMPNQGKTARAHGGAGSGFLTRPCGREADFRFAVAGRLNVVDTLSALKRQRLRTHDRCRHPGCSRTETLAHVLNHCRGTMDAVHGRHNESLKNIERALFASSGDAKDRVELRVNQTVPSLAGPALRPDLQLYNHTKKTVVVVDLAVVFEEQASDGPKSSGLVKAATDNETKYAGVKCHLQRQRMDGPPLGPRLRLT